jgi:branched-chain amino acid transport system ATP-binding protein
MVVREGELVCLLGGNASGKSTTLKTILGIVRPRTGRVLLNGEDVTAMPTAHRIKRGLAIVPENRRLFGPMTVSGHEIGAYGRRPTWRSSARLDLSRCSTSGARSSPGRCLAVNSRWWRWGAR